MVKPFTIKDFFKRFPNDDACLDHLFEVRYGKEPVCPKCGQIGTFHRLAKMPAYTCNCGHHIHPMAGTPFLRTRTPLQKWFYAMYLFTTTRHGVPAKELQRQLGVTYKCAWRIGHEIRKYMGWVDGDAPLSGEVEVDEMFVGGVRNGRPGRTTQRKAIVMAMVQRGGDVITEILPDLSNRSLLPPVHTNVKAGSAVYTDGWKGYRELGMHLRHEYVDHDAKEYVRGRVHTNTIEGFWAMVKRSIRGTHIHVSQKHLDKYLQEFEFRFNLRKSPLLMFDLLLAAFPRP